GLVEHSARCERRAAVRLRIGHRTRMAELGRYRSTLRVHRVGELTQARGRLRTPQDLVSLTAPLGGHGAVGHGRHTHSTGGVANVEVDEVVGDEAVATESLVGRSLD